MRIFSFLKIDTKGIIKYTLVLNTKIVATVMLTFFLSLGTRVAKRIIATEKIVTKRKVVRVVTKISVPDTAASEGICNFY